MPDDKFQRRYGPWATILGGSEGIGAAFARDLGNRGFNLVLVARRPAPLADLATRLRQQQGVEVRTLALDLGAREASDVIIEATRPLDVGLLVCSAADSRVASFFNLGLDEKLHMLDVNCRTPLAVVHGLGQRMKARGRGGIILMSSLAGVYGGPFVATYAATKAFARLLGESLSAELGSAGVDVIACVAGPTHTPTYEREVVGDAQVMRPEVVVAETLAALGRRPSLIPGRRNRILHWFVNQLPRGWVIKLVAANMRKILARRSNRPTTP